MLSWSVIEKMKFGKEENGYEELCKKDIYNDVCLYVAFSAVYVNNSINAEAAAKVTKIKLSKKKLTINVGSSKKLTASLSPAKAKERKVTWISSNKKVANVKNGKVIGVSVGTATITAKAGGKKASCNVKVTLSEKAKEAIKAYKKYLGNKIIKRDTRFVDSEDVKFALADVNVDGVPELFYYRWKGKFVTKSKFS